MGGLKPLGNSRILKPGHPKLSSPPNHLSGGCRCLWPSPPVPRCPQGQQRGWHPRGWLLGSYLGPKGHWPFLNLFIFELVNCRSRTREHAGSLRRAVAELRGSAFGSAALGHCGAGPYWDKALGEKEGGTTSSRACLCCSSCSRGRGAGNGSASCGHHPAGFWWSLPARKPNPSSQRPWSAQLWFRRRGRGGQFEPGLPPVVGRVDFTRAKRDGFCSAWPPQSKIQGRAPATGFALCWRSNKRRQRPAVLPWPPAPVPSLAWLGESRI